MNPQGPAKTQGLSLFLTHLQIVDKAVRLLGLSGNVFSPAIQFVLTDWARMRGLSPEQPVGFPSVLFIGPVQWMVGTYGK